MPRFGMEVLNHSRQKPVTHEYEISKVIYGAIGSGADNHAVPRFPRDGKGNSEDLL